MRHRCIMRLCLSPTAYRTLIQQQPDAIFGTHAPLISRRESIAAKQSHVHAVEFSRQLLRINTFHCDRERRACASLTVWMSPTWPFSQAVCAHCFHRNTSGKKRNKVLTSMFASFSLTLESHSVSFDSRTAAAHMVTWGQLIIYSMLARTNL